MIYLTGDMHGKQRLDEIVRFAENCSNLDYLIILGDFGGIWDSDTSVVDRLTVLSCKILFIDGNHENFDLLNDYPTEDWGGGRVHKVAKNVMHLMRGELYSIEGKTFFTFGGAISRDKLFRREGVSWWPQEEAKEDELNHAEDTLKKIGRVDYVLTHCGNMEAVQRLAIRQHSRGLTVCRQSIRISQLLAGIPYQKWFCGHYHIDAEIGKYVFLYKTFYWLGRGEESK